MIFTVQGPQMLVMNLVDPIDTKQCESNLFLELLVRHRLEKKLSGESMIGVGIHDGNILVGDRSETAAHGKIVVVALDGEMTVKRLHLKGGRCRLVPENKAFQPSRLAREQDLQVWGVVRSI